MDDGHWSIGRDGVEYQRAQAQGYNGEAEVTQGLKVRVAGCGREQTLSKVMNYLDYLYKYEKLLIFELFEKL